MDRTILKGTSISRGLDSFKAIRHACFMVKMSTYSIKHIEVH